MDPCGKKCYSAEEAGRVINLAKSKRWSPFHKKRPIRRYWCGRCRAYHVTSEFRRRKKKEKRPFREIQDSYVFRE